MSDTPLSQNTKMNRRAFLNAAWLASLGFLVLDLGGVAYLFSMPIFEEGEFGSNFTLGRAGDVLPPPGGDPVNYPKGKFWLSRTSDNHIVAPYKVCAHLGCLYNWNSSAGMFICPCHDSHYQLDGTVIKGPADYSVDRFVIRLFDDSGVEVSSTDPQGNPLPLPDDDLTVVIDTGERIRGKPRGVTYPVE
jgi:cytochrome b6-f complex iron-sulfur subunit